MSDFYERNNIERPATQAKSQSELLGMRPPERVLRTAIHLLARTRSYRGETLWAIVSKLTGHGCGYSEQICKELEWDPNMRVWPKTTLPTIKQAPTSGDSQ